MCMCMRCADAYTGVYACVRVGQICEVRERDVTDDRMVSAVLAELYSVYGVAYRFTPVGKRSLLLDYSIVREVAEITHTELLWALGYGELGAGGPGLQESALSAGTPPRERGRRGERQQTVQRRHRQE